MCAVNVRAYTAALFIWFAIKELQSEAANGKSFKRFLYDV